MQPYNSGDFKKISEAYIKKSPINRRRNDPKREIETHQERRRVDGRGKTRSGRRTPKPRNWFLAIPRLSYIARKSIAGESFSPLFFFPDLLGHLNFMRPDPTTFTKKPRFLFRDRTLFKKRNRLQTFHNRNYMRSPLEQFYTPYLKDRVPEISLWNVEELATIYHFPVTDVGAPGIVKTEAVKAEAPANLPIEE